MGGDGGGRGGGEGGAGGSAGGGMGGKIGLEMVTLRSDLGKPRSLESWLTITSSVNTARRCAASVGPPCCVTTIRAVTACKTDETGTTLVPKAISLPKGRAAVRLSLAAMARVVLSGTT